MDDKNERCYGLTPFDDDALFADIIHVIFGPGTSAKEARVHRSMNEIKRFYDEFHPLKNESAVLDLGDPRYMEGLAKLAKTILRNKVLSRTSCFYLAPNQGCATSCIR